MNIISVNPAWCYTGDEFGYMYVPTCFCRQEFEKWQCINSSVLTDFPLFLNEHISLLHQNGSLMLQNLTRTKIIIIIKSFRKKEVEMYQQVKIMRRDGGRATVSWLYSWKDTCTSSVFHCLCCPCFMFKGEAAERNFSGELNLAKKVAWNQALGRRGENCAAGRWATEGRQEISANKSNEVWFVSMVKKCVWRWI